MKYTTWNCTPALHLFFKLLLESWSPGGARAPRGSRLATFLPKLPGGMSPWKPCWVLASWPHHISWIQLHFGNFSVTLVTLTIFHFIIMRQNSSTCFAFQNVNLLKNQRKSRCSTLIDRIESPIRKQVSKSKQRFQSSRRGWGNEARGHRWSRFGAPKRCLPGRRVLSLRNNRVLDQKWNRSDCSTPKRRIQWNMDIKDAQAAPSAYLCLRCGAVSDLQANWAWNQVQKFYSMEKNASWRT